MMPSTIDQVINDVLKAEGGYVHDPNDRGGETNFGITIATARANGYTGPMKVMTKDFARSVYMKQYVQAPGFDKIASISMPIAAELVDTGVNMGPKVPAQFLQRALNGLNNQGKDYPDLIVDGNAGAKTRDALTAYLKKRGKDGEQRLLGLLNALQGERYLSLCEGRSANETFLFGWLARIAACFLLILVSACATLKDQATCPNAQKAVMLAQAAVDRACPAVWK